MDHVLYYVASPDRRVAPQAEQALEAASRRASPLRARQIRVSFETSSARALARLRSGGADALVVDATGEVGGAEDSAALGLLRALFDEHELGSIIGRDRTWLVVGPGSHGAGLAFEAGRLRLAGAVSASGPGEPAASIWERIVATVSRRHGGKIALCLAGGGTEGLFYELGCLRALEHFLPGFPLSDVEIVCGISAGAVLAGLLANGVGPTEMKRGLNEGTGRVLPVRRSDLFDVDVRSFATRAASLSWDVLRGKRSPLSALFRLPPAGIFAGRKLEDWLRRQYALPGMTDRFEELRHKLFIGATDQDSNQHVVFGAPGAPTVPIHRAIRASTALAPFYAPEKIDGRYYVDGGFTRTTNMRVAVQQGATLVLLVDPLVPLSSQRAGDVADRGAIFSAVQGLKSLINGRFDKAVPTLRAMYPHVSFHLFQPGPSARRVMAGSPMKYFYREEIEEIAFRETVREIRGQRLPQLCRDFARHGVSFQDPEKRKISDDGLADEVRVVA